MGATLFWGGCPEEAFSSLEEIRNFNRVQPTAERIFDLGSIRPTAAAASLILGLAASPIVAGSTHLVVPQHRGEDWLSAEFCKVEDLARLSENWDGRGAQPPAFVAAQQAKLILNQSAIADMKPERVIPIPDGGIAIYFTSGSVLTGGAAEKYARFSCDNDGDVLLVRHNRRYGTTDVTQVGIEESEIEEALNLSRDFLA